MTRFTTSSIPSPLVIEVDIFTYYQKLECPNYDGKGDLMNSIDPNGKIGKKGPLSCICILLAIPNIGTLNRDLYVELSKVWFGIQHTPLVNFVLCHNMKMWICLQHIAQIKTLIYLWERARSYHLLSSYTS